MNSGSQSIESQEGKRGQEGKKSQEEKKGQEGKKSQEEIKSQEEKKGQEGKRARKRKGARKGKGNRKRKMGQNGDYGYLDEMEREWREDYAIEKAREISREYDEYLFSCWGPDEYDEPDEYGICRRAMARGTDFSRADRYFALAQEMALRYLDKEFRLILRSSYFWAREVVEYECLYAGKAYDREKVERLTEEYEDCLEKEKQARKRRQENTGVRESYFKACVEVTAILRNAARKDLERIPEELLEFFERNCEPYYEFSVGREQMLWELDLLPETKGLLAMIYREFWCTEEERRDYDRLLAENQRKYEEAKGQGESGPERMERMEPEGLKELFAGDLSGSGMGKSGKSS